MTAALTLKEKLTAFEKDVILKTLEKNDCAIGKSAVELGITRKSLWEKMIRHGIRVLRQTLQTVIYDGTTPVITLKYELDVRKGPGPQS